MGERQQRPLAAASRWTGRLALLAGLWAGAACTGAPSAADAPGTAPVAPTRPEPVTEVAPAVDFDAWRAGFRAKALSAGISPATFDAAFAGISPNRTVLERDRFQPEFSRPIWEYLDSAVSAARVRDGRTRAAGNAFLLSEIETDYGVDDEVVVAIWGLESAYGAVRGDIPVIEGLATLAWDGRRRDFAEEQLLEALRILEAGDVSPAAMRGSWAGAMGHTQFIPTSFSEYAVDFTGDGRRDIWGDDPTDALASTANYLSRFGWRNGAPAVVRVTLPDGFDYTLANDTTEATAADWAARGIEAADGSAIPAGEAVRLLLPAGAAGPAWLTYPNFRVIKRYNNATSYALAVATLANQIAGSDAPRPSQLAWPRGDRPLSRSEKETLQRRLTSLGYDTKGADGIIGPNTRAAARAFQQDRGLTPDGYVSERLLSAVLEASG